MSAVSRPRVAVPSDEDRSIATAIAGGGGPALVAWSLLVAPLVVLGVVVWLLSLQAPPDVGDLMFLGSVVVPLVVFQLVGVLAVNRVPRNLVAWIYVTSPALVAVGLSALLGGVVAELTDALGGSWSGWLALVGGALFTLGVGILGVFGLLLFPDGRLPRRGWQWLAAFGGVSIGVAVIAQALQPALGPDGTISNPIAVGSMANVIDQVGGYAIVAVGVSVVASAVSLMLRYRRALVPEKAQLGWLGLATVLLIIALAAGFMLNLAGLGESVVGQLTRVITYLSVLAVPVSIGFALLRRGLYGAAPVSGNSVVYTVLTLLLASVFGVVVGLVAFLFPGEERLGGALLATAVVAIIVQPLRERVQRRVNRLFYGYRDEPYRVVAGLGQRLGGAGTPEAVLGEIANTIASSLRVPGVSVEMITSEGTVRVDHGEPNLDVTEIPLISGGRTVGRLMVEDREPGHALGEADIRLLEDLAAQAAIAVEASRLAVELRESRRGIVAAREDERLRIRRDLHDGLGSTLTGIGLGLHAASGELTHGDPARRILEDLIAETSAAVDEVRRIAAGLRAPLLDELGLEGAVRQLADRLSQRSPTLEIEVRYECADAQPPSAVEGAVFGIVSEALTNVARHSMAQHCTVRIELNDDVNIEVVDDGVGFGPDVNPGNGVSSMRQRAEELGGRVTITSDPAGGTRVQAVFPSLSLEAI